MQKIIIQFICYSPRVYSGFDKFNLLLAHKLISKGYLPVFVFFDTMNYVPKIEDDLIDIGAKIELISSNGNNLWLKIWKLYEKYKPIIVHTHFDNKVKIITGIFSVLYHAEHYTSFHSQPLLCSLSDYIKEKGCIKRELLGLYYRFLLSTSKKIFTVSEAIKFAFEDISRSKSSKIITLFLGVDTLPHFKNKLELKIKYDLPFEKLLICNISAIEHIKGIDIILKSIYILKNEFKSTNFFFCHIGGIRAENDKNYEYLKKLQDQTKELKIDDCIKWMGLINDISELISVFDIYVHPSRSEGLGLSIMEAAVQSLPIVGSQIGGIPEIVKEGVNGFLFESENAVQLAEVLHKLIINKHLRDQMGKQSYKIVIENYNIDLQTNKLLEHYIN